jgi:hypothetical protein
MYNCNGLLREFNLILISGFGHVSGCRCFCNSSRDIDRRHIFARGEGLDRSDKPVAATR